MGNHAKNLALGAGVPGKTEIVFQPSASLDVLPIAFTPIQVFNYPGNKKLLVALIKQMAHDLKAEEWTCWTEGPGDMELHVLLTIKGTEYHTAITISLWGHNSFEVTELSAHMRTMKLAIMEWAGYPAQEEDE